MPTKAKDWTGQRFGRLVAIRKTEQKQGEAWVWLWACNCGANKLAVPSNVRRGKVRSCGCLAREARQKGLAALAKRNLPQGVGAAYALYRRYQFRAKERGIVFDIDRTSFLDLTSRPCAYCGALPSQVCRPKASGDYTYNGLDRVDNEGGYTLDNVVPCCKTCNFMKQGLDRDTFLAHIQRIAERIGAYA